MRVPIGWLRDYVELPAEPARIAGMLADLGFPVAAIETRPAITGVVAGRIASLEKHPNADRLLVGRIDIGDGKPLTIATAATNVAGGQRIAVATVGAQLPQLRIERRTMRGVESEGMMISADELALPAEWFEDGIMQFDADPAPGTDVIEYFRLNEAVLDVEVTSNRVDAMSVIGLARELAAYQKIPLRMPEFRNPGKGGEKPDVTLESPDCRRFVAQLFTGVRAECSPAWMRIRLALCGQRPINQLVDVSNYVMLETGQPLHFYDAAKIPRHHLIVRDAHDGESLVALDGTEHKLDPSVLVIASQKRAECLAGLMGARSSEVTEATRELLLEAANFSGPRIRRTAARLGFRTEASSRHEKNLPPALTDIGAARAAQLLASFGAEAHAATTFGDALKKPEPIAFKITDVPRLLGFELPAEEIRESLDRLGFKVDARGREVLSVIPPPWRTDISVSADIVEEVARIVGYDRIEATIPAVRPHEIESRIYGLERLTGATLCALGYREIVSYSLHGQGRLERLRQAGFLTSPPVEVLNPLSEEQRYLRTALEPGMLEYLARLAAPVRIFEIGRVFYKEDRQPLESSAVTFGFSAEPVDEPAWHDSNFLRLKSDCEAFLRNITGRDVTEVAADSRVFFHPGRCGVLLMDGREVAVAGQVHPRLQHAFDIRFPVYLCSLHLANLPQYEIPQFKAPSKYPSTYRDLALVCDLDLPAQRVEVAIRDAIGADCTGVLSFDEYRGSQVPEGKKSLAIRVTLQKTDATITDAQADGAIQKAVAILADRFGTTLRV